MKTSACSSWQAMTKAEWPPHVTPGGTMSGAGKIEFPSVLVSDFPHVRVSERSARK
jgi:hypothetical protein